MHRVALAVVLAACGSSPGATNDAGVGDAGTDQSVAPDTNTPDSGACTYDPKATNCFAKPSACCYPDKTNTGVPPGTSLTSLTGLVEIEDGSVTVAGNAVTSAPWLSSTTVDGETYLTLTGISLEGGMYITQDHVRIVNSMLSGGDVADQTSCASGGPPALGSSLVTLSPKATHFRIEDSTLHGDSAGCDTSDSQDDSGCKAGATKTGSGISNDADETSQALRIQAYWLDSPWHGPGTVSDSYLLDDAFMFCAHYEPIYIADTTLVVKHSTLLNIHDQTAAIFVDTSGNAGDSHLTVTDSLLAGGGYTLYPAGNSKTVGTGTMDIERNRFARCTSTSCPDSHGYFPQSGYFGLAAYCYTGAGQTWSSNTWDDDVSSIADPCN
ncbi:MAG TPA: hypothetical protein VH054_06160 [Polyangiaceae bacterium]|jgi:hypothetical protein|nr:hypothetical protein [Polyangiaceae bacterium]